MLETDKLDILLNHLGIKLGGVALGNNPGSVQEVARAIRKSIIDTNIRSNGRPINLED